MFNAHCIYLLLYTFERIFDIYINLSLLYVWYNNTNNVILLIIFDKYIGII